MSTISSNFQCAVFYCTNTANMRAFLGEIIAQKKTLAIVEPHPNDIWSVTVPTENAESVSFLYDDRANQTICPDEMLKQYPIQTQIKSSVFYCPFPDQMQNLVERIIGFGTMLFIVEPQNHDIWSISVGVNDHQAITDLFEPAQTSEL